MFLAFVSCIRMKWRNFDKYLHFRWRKLENIKKRRMTNEGNGKCNVQISVCLFVYHNQVFKWEIVHSWRDLSSIRTENNSRICVLVWRKMQFNWMKNCRINHNCIYWVKWKHKNIVFACRCWKHTESILFRKLFEENYKSFLFDTN